MGAFRGGERGVSAHHRAHGEFLGLRGVYSMREWDYGGASPGSALLHAAHAVVHNVCPYAGERWGAGQCDVRPGERGHNNVSVLDYSAFRAQDGQRGGGRRGANVGWGAGGGRGRRGCAVLHVFRYVLVLGSRGGGVRVVVALHRSGVLGGAQVGERGGRASLRALAGAYRAAHGAFNRSASAQFASHTGNCADILL